MRVKIDKLVFGGQGMGRVGEKVVFVWGALPGEEVEITPTKNKSNFVEGVVKEVIVPSPDRLAPVDDHHVSCSPWQIMSYAMENEWKKTIALETYRRIAGIELSDIEIVSPAEPYHYRNKMEYNFFVSGENKISLAFHTRGTHSLIPIGDCALASAAINECSHGLLEWINEEKIPRRSLKSIIIRSNDAGQTAAAFFVKDPIAFKRIPELAADFIGFQIYLSDYRSPASVPTEQLYTAGSQKLETTLLNTRLQYGLLSFFQINAPVFQKTLEEIGSHISTKTVMDFYAGAGSISLPLHQRYERAVLVEENKEAVAYAKENIALNGITNATVVHSLAEEALTHIDTNATLIVDPPRTGLHKRVVETILERKPEKVIYLSCGLDTHARDLGMLSAGYRPIHWKLFNFFPRTPHIESLCVLERK